MNLRFWNRGPRANDKMFNLDAATQAEIKTITEGLIQRLPNLLPQYDAAVQAAGRELSVEEKLAIMKDIQNRNPEHQKIKDEAISKIKAIINRTQVSKAA